MWGEIFYVLLLEEDLCHKLIYSFGLGNGLIGPSASTPF